MYVLYDTMQFIQYMWVFYDFWALPIRPYIKKFFSTQYDTTTMGEWFNFTREEGSLAVGWI